MLATTFAILIPLAYLMGGSLVIWVVFEIVDWIF